MDLTAVQRRLLLEGGIIDLTSDMKAYIKEVKQYYVKLLLFNIKNKGKKGAFNFETGLLENEGHKRIVDGGQYGKVSIETKFEHDNNSIFGGHAGHKQWQTKKAKPEVRGSITVIVDFVKDLADCVTMIDKKYSHKEIYNDILHNDHISYVMRHELIHTFDPKLLKLPYDSSKINIYAKPDENSEIKKHLENGEIIYVPQQRRRPLRASDKWIDVQYPNPTNNPTNNWKDTKRGYIRRNNLRGKGDVTWDRVTSHPWTHKDTNPGKELSTDPKRMIKWAEYYTSPWEVDAFASEHVNGVFESALKNAHDLKGDDPQKDFLGILKNTLKMVHERKLSGAVKFWKNPQKFFDFYNYYAFDTSELKKKLETKKEKVVANRSRAKKLRQKMSHGILSQYEELELIDYNMMKVSENQQIADIKNLINWKNKILKLCKTAYKKLLKSINDKYQKFSEEYRTTHPQKPYKPNKKRYVTCYKCNERKPDEAAYFGIEKDPDWICKKCYREETKNRAFIANMDPDRIPEKQQPYEKGGSDISWRHPR